MDRHGAGWEKSYALIFEIHKESAEAQYLT